VGSGWEFDVFVTADGWAFRFPRRAEYQGLFDREGPALALARAALPPEIAVPRVELLGAPSLAFPYRFAGHRFIEGVAADAVPASGRAETARTIGAALGAIHSVPVTAARAAGLCEMRPPDEGAYDWFRRNLTGARQLIHHSGTAHRAVAWVSALDDPLRPLAAPLRFVHNDLSPEHLVVQPSTGRLVGILDWTFPALGDPARDFVACATFGGWGFVERVLAHYPGAVDAGFRERLRYMARFLSVMWLGEAQLNGGDVRKHVTWLENAFDAEAARQPRSDPPSPAT
jgi:aminoglycoside phosphotransferase (APT) family kinase protein